MDIFQEVFTLGHFIIVCYVSLMATLLSRDIKRNADRLENTLRVENR